MNSVNSDSVFMLGVVSAPLKTGPEGAWFYPTLK
jgi:hypothetical protein